MKYLLIKLFKNNTSSTYKQNSFINKLYILLLPSFIFNSFAFKAPACKFSDLNFYEEVSENFSPSTSLTNSTQALPSETMLELLDPTICADWMEEVCNHVVTGNPTGKQNNRKNKQKLNKSKNTQYLSVQDICDKLNQVMHYYTNAIYPTDHIIYHLSSLPLSQKQQKAFDEYVLSLDTDPNSDKLSDFIQSMHHWDYQDFFDMITLYKKYNDDIGEEYPPFIYWLSELFDLRIANLPTPDMKAIVEALGPDFVNKFFNKYFPHLQYTDEELLKMQTEFLNMIYYLMQDDKLALSNIQLALQKTLKEMLHGRTNVSERIRYFVDNLSDEIGVPAEHIKSQKMKEEIENFAHTLYLLFNKLKQSHSAKKILSNWNARNFQLLGGSDPTYHSHPIYGKLLPYEVSAVKKPFSSLNKDNNLVPSLSQWNAFFYKYPFPADLFQRKTNLQGEIKSFEFINSNNATDLIIDFFNFMRKSFGDEETKKYYDDISKFYFKITKMNPTTKQLESLDISGDLSSILGSIIEFVNEQAESENINTQTAVYQALYQILLTIAISDNKFCQKILSYQFPIFTTNSILDTTNADEVKYNPMGFLLCHIRSILIALARTSPEFIDFLTYYYEEVDALGNIAESGQCRMALENATEEADDFTSVLMQSSFNKDSLNNPELKKYETPSSDKVLWIQPFSFTQELKYLVSRLYTISLYDISKEQLTPPIGMKIVKKQMNTNQALFLFSLPVKTNLTYYPAMTEEFCKYYFSDPNNSLFPSITTLQTMEAKFLDQINDQNRMQKIIEAMELLLSQSENPEMIKQIMHEKTQPPAQELSQTEEIAQPETLSLEN